MTDTQTVSPSELRANLASFLAAAEGGARILVAGRSVALQSHQPDTTEIPEQLLRQIISGFVVGAAELELASLSDPRRPYTTGMVVHPGDPTGSLVAWLWRTNRPLCAITVADLYAHMADHSPHAMPGLDFADLLAGLHFALPTFVEPAERKQIIDYLRQEVPGYYGRQL